MKFLMWIALNLITVTTWAAGASSTKYILGAGLMVLNSETQQGGVGPSGSTVLTQIDFLKTYKMMGYGIVFNYDKHGKNEIDSSYGIKLEFHLDKFYFEAAYLLSAKRAYTDRSIAEESGDGLLYGFGARFPIGRGGDKGPFFHASYKIKNQNLKKQDGVDLSEPIKQTDGYPVFGFGYNF